jgi:hypothetical protein
MNAAWFYAMAPGITRCCPRRSRCGISTALAAILLAGPAFAADAPGPETHTFTNSTGKTIQAQIVNVDNDTVYLKRTDSKSFQVTIDTLGQDDQAYIRNWAIKEALQDGSPIFDISAELTKGSMNTVNGWVHWNSGYKVKLVNKTTLHLLNPTVQYILFNLKSNGADLKTSGSKSLTEVPADDAVTFDTVTVGVQQWANTLTDNYIVNKPIGIWVRVYDDNQQLLQEWAAPLDLVKNETWDTSPPRGSGKKKTPPARSGDSGAGDSSGGNGGDTADSSGGAAN